ncbi:phosphohydrolase [Aerococcus urinaehominis]|uniref:Phosphohydrolase n=1 Tax=Aerococcus urinaehominis TaxID=128944 RepID=A0A0X8FLM6_9LACT|nr:phosphohydrolase [Aerococcus urinaehominis]AMB98902.1 phosphohydrolase [Aerococcus urinaehominis]SDM60950.1 uncharacterized protein SAMN04487985_1295 [Aerococcus urinaehominis]
MPDQDYAWKSDVHFQAIIADIKDHPFVTDLKRYPQHIHGNRYVHSFAVAYYSYKICKALRWDYVAVAHAGLLHDLFYYQQGEVSFSKGNHLTNHPKIALINARLVTDLTPKEEDIILKHMWLATAKLPRYKESFVVTFVDKYVAVDEYVRPTTRQLLKAFRQFLLRIVFPRVRSARQSDQIEDVAEEIEDTIEENEESNNE